LKDTNWKGIDYLIVDMPPGTGDTQLTLAQKIPVSGAVIVSTPQDIALLDALKGLRMFEKVEVPVLGIVENMGLYVCPSCGHEEHIFAQGGAEKMAADEGVAFLGSLPLNKQIREDADQGKPTVVSDPESPLSAVYRDVARRAAAKLAMQKKNYASKFPNIVIQ
jgi:ATP-binding protein involved in chromosome partitioning